MIHHNNFNTSYLVVATVIYSRRLQYSMSTLGHLAKLKPHIPLIKFR